MPASGKPSNLARRQFGDLYVVRRAPNEGKRTAWLCRCACGQEVVIRGSRLLAGSARTCGKGHKSKALILLVARAEHQAWVGMWARCAPRNGVQRYSGRGIKVCP